MAFGKTLNLFKIMRSRSLSIVMLSLVNKKFHVIP